MSKPDQTVRSDGIAVKYTDHRKCFNHLLKAETIALVDLSLPVHPVYHRNPVHASI